MNPILVKTISQKNKHFTSGKLLKRLFKGYIVKHYKKLSFAILAMIIIAGTTAAYAKIMEPLIDEVLVNRNPLSLILVPLTFILIAATKSIATYTQSYLMGIFGQRIIADIQNNLFSHLVFADLTFHQNKNTGTLISTFLNDANLLREALTKALTGITKDSLTLIFLIIVLFITDWQLALVATVGFPIAILPVRNIGKRMRKASTLNQERTGDFSKRIAESFYGIRQIKSYTMEKNEIDKTKFSNELRLKAMFRVVRARAAATPIIEMLGGIAIATVIFYAAGFGDAVNRLTAGQFITFITALGLAYQPLRSIANLNTALQEGLAAAQRIFETMDTVPNIKDIKNAKDLHITNGVIHFNNVSFGYEKKNDILLNINFKAYPGQKIAIVGPSGSGKSTILNLIPRLFDINNGSILIDNQDIRTVKLNSLRAQIAFVSQDSILFNDTIRENILYGKPYATEEEVLLAAKKAAAEDFLDLMPSGLNTLVGEMGDKLSGGQRQRINIARAMLKDAPILLLDEATSSLDADSERQVQESLNKLIHGKTTIVVAHRLSTIADSDLILTVENGRIVETGNHKELIEKNGLYAKLYSENEQK